MVKTQMADATQNPYVVRSKNGDIYFKIIDEIHPTHTIFLSESDLAQFAALHSNALFSYTYPIIEEPKPMQAPTRERKDEILTYEEFFRKMQGVKIPTSIREIRPL